MRAKILLVLIPLLLLSSCNVAWNWYQVTLNARGVSPNVKSYYITSSNSTLVSTLEFKEYAFVLRNRLNEIGYTETAPNKAAIAIFFDYQLGDTFLAHTVLGQTNPVQPIFKIPLLVSISAVENRSKEIIWAVSVRDEIERETQIQSVMPWLILCAQPYFGRSSYGEITVKVDNTKVNRERYNLIWPY